jgi:hypothetical protein
MPVKAVTLDAYGTWTMYWARRQQVCRSHGSTGIGVRVAPMYRRHPWPSLLTHRPVAKCDSVLNRFAISTLIGAEDFDRIVAADVYTQRVHRRSAWQPPRGA